MCNSIIADYCATCGARSKKEFISKSSVVEEKADERLLLLEIIIESYIAKKSSLIDLTKKPSEILSVIVVSEKTTRENHNSKIITRKSSIQ